MTETMHWIIRSFPELSVNELYDLLQLRGKVFVVEQKSAYLDCDGKDKQAYHLLLIDDQFGLIACSRLLPPGVAYPEASIGRVVVHPDWRGRGLAHEMMAVAITQSIALFKIKNIRISAQKHLQGFYRQHGFIPVTGEYLEDDILHVGMLYTKMDDKRSHPATIYYLDHSAWLVRTEKRLLLFDYGAQPFRPVHGRLEDGVLDLDQLPALPMFAFASHKHADHFSAQLQHKLSQRADTYFILGLDAQPDAAEKAACPAGTWLAWPQSQLSLADLTIHFSGSTDSGVSVLIDSPEGVFYHGGDLAIWDDTPFFHEKYRQEIDFLSERIEESGRRPDLMFLPVSTSDGYQEEALLQGAWYALTRMQPRMIMPMHAHGFEDLYRRFARLAEDAGWPGVMVFDKPGASEKVALTGK